MLRQRPGERACDDGGHATFGCFQTLVRQAPGEPGAGAHGTFSHIIDAEWRGDIVQGKGAFPPGWELSGAVPGGGTQGPWLSLHGRAVHNQGPFL